MVGEQGVMNYTRTFQRVSTIFGIVRSLLSHVPNYLQCTGIIHYTLLSPTMFSITCNVRA